MTPADQQLVRALYKAALERPAAERAAFVAAHTAGDPQLRESLERLLSRDAATDVGTGPSAREEAPGLAAGTVVGNYRIDSVLGRGGAGHVYRATDVRLQRSVAIKFLAASLADESARRRFAREAESASALNHPHIVTVHDVGEHEGRQYIVSELVDGGTLDDWLAIELHTWRQTVEMLTGVAEAVAAAHAAGVLHRDIKPSNILVGTNGYAKLADFGLAKLFERGASVDSRLETGASIVVGTASYMSPEQASGRPLDARSDVFSFGIVLYEALAGRRPFDADNELELLRTIMHGAAAPLPAAIPELLRNSVERALEKDPADRYQSMRELAIELRRAARAPASPAPSDRLAAAPQPARWSPRMTVGLAGTAIVLGVSAFMLWRSPTEPVSPFERGRYVVTQLTTVGDAVTPAISPDGRSVAYAQTLGETSSGLYMRRVATQSNVLLVPPEPSVLAFAPTITANGEFVDYLRLLVGERAGPALWRVPLLGGTPRELAQDVWGPVGRSPDGRQIAFVRFDLATNESSLVVMGANGGDERVVLTRDLPRGLLSVAIVGVPVVRPAWSPDGERIAVLEFGDGRAAEPSMRVLFVDVATGAETSLPTGTTSPPQGLGWLGSDSLVLSYAEVQGGRVQLWRLAYPGGEIAPITNDLLSYVGVDVDAAGTSFVTSREESRRALWILDADGANAREVIRPTPYGAARDSVWWAGGRVYYHTSVDERPALAAIAPDGGPEEFVAEVQGAATTADGGTLVYLRGGGLWRKEGALQPVRMESGDAADPHVTPDGRKVVFLSARNGLQSPWIMSLTGGEPSEVVNVFAGAGSLDISPDGTQLLFISQDRQMQPVVVICSLPACAERREVRLPSIGVRSASPRFMPNGREIAYVDATGTNLAALSPDGVSIRRLTSFADTEADASRVINAFAWAPDGRRLAVLLGSRTNDIVLFRAAE